MPRFIPSQPVQGAMYHRLTALIAANYAGMGPQNVASAQYAPMVGRSFQKPLSGSTTTPSTVGAHPYR